MLRAQGDQKLADYLFDCSYYEYFQRQLNWNMYQDAMKEEYEKNKQKK
jgi:hypothetical protein